MHRCTGSQTRYKELRGFTLLELLVVVGIIAILISILAPTISGAIAKSRSFQCQMSQRSVAFDFQIFADVNLHGDRGDDGDGQRFSIETFQENQYRVDEFWDYGDEIGSIELPDAYGNDPMRCPEVRQPLTLRNNIACSSGAVGPGESVSYAFNARLDRAEIIDSRGRPRAIKVKLRPSILSQSNVPLLIDVDGQAAQESGVNPIYIAPSLDSQGPYANERMWFPDLRHNGKANIAFIDGHVESSSKPEANEAWRWDYQPTR
ncbi:MAG: prepilin-type N-terminal cleavage/methylation domain-containing protein [Phycisphaerales bacterium]|nr:prepilin-type N-terminal cleavage/methylation domain-containing protein [Phycisphaerales bacterium]